MSAGFEIDPLDAYMDSIAGEVTQQATEMATPSQGSPPWTSSRRQQPASPSRAQRAIADKVAASPFCDVLTGTSRGVGDRWEHRTGNGVTGCASQPNAAGGNCGGAGEAAEACVRLLLADPAEFLSRFGHILSPADLESLLPSQDSAVTLHVERLRTLMLSQQQRQRTQQQQQEERPASLSAHEDVDMSSAPTTTTAAGREAGTVGGGGTGGDGGGARVRNRRYRRLKQLAEGGVWFSDEAMKERDPWLWFEHVGKRAGEEKPAPKQAVEQVPGSTSVGTYLQESLGFLSQPQSDGGWDTGLPAAAEAGGSRGMGSSLGMAFLSGVCADAGALHVRAGATVDLSHIPPAHSTGAAAAVASSGLPNASNNGVSAELERSPDSDDEMDTGTAAVTAGVGAIGIGGGAADAADGVADGAAGGGESSGDRQDGGTADGGGRRVRFVDERGVDLGGGESRGEQADDTSDYMQEQEEEEEEEGGDGEEEVGAGREEVARILSERFLAGLEEGVNYKSVDEDERLDDLDQLARDEQDRWFRGEEDGYL